MTDDVVIGTISGYDWPAVHCWANSLDSCGFNGRKVVIACNAAHSVTEAFANRAYEVVTYATDSFSGDAYYPVDGFTNDDASAERFFLTWKYLRASTARPRYVICTDVKDLLFQTDPSAWLETWLGDKELTVSSDRMRYEDEAWNSGSMLENFGPIVHEHMRERVVWNAGAIAGSARCMSDLCLAVHLLCRASKAPYSDQAAVNILLSMKAFGRVTRFNTTDAAWAYHAGTSADRWVLERNGPKLLEAGAGFDGDSLCTPSGTKYCLVHQYDRVREWRDALHAKYCGAASDRPW